MEILNLEYIPILLFFVISIIIALVLFFGTYYLNPKYEDIEKLSAYECGFEPFERARTRFDVRFYLVSILFIIFDLEVMFLFPWALLIEKLNIFGFVVIVYFLLILTIGFFYEWVSGALDWDK
jgi:NADH-quinone oxidoreductase subunit A